MFQHARIDSRQFMGVRALEKNAPAVTLFQEMRRYRHHALNARDFGRRPHIDVKIRAVVNRVFLDDEPETRNDPILF